MKTPAQKYKEAIKDAFEQYLDGNITKQERETQIRRAYSKMARELKREADHARN